MRLGLGQGLGLGLGLGLALGLGHAERAAREIGDRARSECSAVEAEVLDVNPLRLKRGLPGTLRGEAC